MKILEKSSLFLFALLIPGMSLAAEMGLSPVSSQDRLEYIRHAQIWSAQRIPSLDIILGPEGEPRFSYEETVECTYVPSKPKGTTSKFHCARDPQRDSKKGFKVRYEEDNGKVYAQPAATRLFWALGFGAQRAYPVRVICQNCPKDPFGHPDLDIGKHTFDPAAIEVKLKGKKIEEQNFPDQGWRWSELRDVETGVGGATPAQIDALKLLAAFVQHGDNNETQQKLVCLPGGIIDDGHGRGVCSKPFMYVADLGSTFGSARLLNEQASMNHARWSEEPVWKDAQQCIANLTPQSDGSLRDPKISEAGRKFLAGLLVQLSDRQIEDLFKVGRADRRDQGVNTKRSSYVSLTHWVATFKDKRAQIVNHRCVGPES